MPFRIRGVDDGRILLVVATGSAQYQDWLALLRREDLRTRRSSLLIDLRRRADLPSLTTARNVGADLASAATRLSAVAMVAQPGAQYGLSRMANALAEGGGLAIRTFNDLREAYEWLRAGAGA